MKNPMLKLINKFHDIKETNKYKNLNDNNFCYISGYIWKKPNLYFRFYKKRYFVLFDKILKYYKKENSKICSGLINFEITPVELKIISKEKFRFNIKILNTNKII